MRTLVVLPTYNERDNLPVVIIKLLAQEAFNLLIIDDNSTDGTKDVALHWTERDQRVNLINRPRKLGLGTAYITGFKWGLENGYECLIEMDSDLSHNPLDLPRFAEEVESGSDLVIGSRYLGGKISVVGWDFRRLMLSRFGNFYASFFLGAPFSDMTSGFRAYSRNALERLDLDRIHSEGYSFQIEMAYYIWRMGLKVKEIPIVFTERAKGTSKMSKKIVREAVWLPWGIKVKELRQFLHLGGQSVMKTQQWEGSAHGKKE
jgi:dolichol-phosphate mannosyltransferase